MKFDVIITNATVIDGTGKDSYHSDIGITEDKITALQNLSGHKALTIIDAKNQVVAPGFIDILSHADNYWSLFDYPEAESFISQGITTVIGGNCGSSLAPVVTKDSLLSIQKWTDARRTSVQWASFSEFLRFLDQVSLPVNFGSLVGHSTLRRSFLGDEVRGLKPSELESLLETLERALREGAFGLSTGLGYAHEEFAPQEEIESFARVVQAHDALYSTHIRNEGANLLKSVEEALKLAKSVDVRVEIAHMKAKGKPNYQTIDEVIIRIQEAIERGNDIGFNLYPYSTTLSVLYPYLPSWSYEGGMKHLLENLRGKVTRKRIISEMQKGIINFARLTVAKADGLSNVIGKNFEQISEAQETSVEEAVLDVIESARGRLLVFDPSLSPEVVQRLLFHHAASVATDDGYYDTDKIVGKNELVHPRAYGTFPKFLELVRLTKAISLEDAIFKLTGRVATRLRLRNRGTLEKGKAADVVIFDPETVGSDADFEAPFVKAKGIQTVIINGKVAYQHNELTHAGSGRALRFGAS